MSGQDRVSIACCPDCRRIHCTGDVIAVGRFDPAGVHGYRPATGGQVRATRAEAMADVCATRRTLITPGVMSS